MNPAAWFGVHALACWGIGTPHWDTLKGGHRTVRFMESPESPPDLFTGHELGRDGVSAQRRHVRAEQSAALGGESPQRGLGSDLPFR